VKLSGAKPTVGLVQTEPISDDLLSGALGAQGFACIPIRPEAGRLLTLRALLRCDLIMKSFGAYSPGYFRLFAVAKALGKRVAVYWIGSDVLHATLARRSWARRTQRLVDMNLTVTDALRDEMQQLGIRAYVVPIVSDLSSIRVEPLPDRLVVLCYLPPNEHLFYSSEVMRELALCIPDIPFLVVGGWQGGPSPPNMECLGFVTNMAAVYRRSSVLVRLTPHDGLPKMLLEALAYGRQVIWSHPFPHCRLARNLPEVLQALLDVKTSPVLNHAGATYVREHYSFDAFSRSLAAHLRNLL
jgi:glycosyltransferase involved in cell wall biosynthesis